MNLCMVPIFCSEKLTVCLLKYCISQFSLFFPSQNLYMLYFGGLHSISKSLNFSPVFHLFTSLCCIWVYFLQVHKLCPRQHLTYHLTNSMRLFSLIMLLGPEVLLCSLNHILMFLFFHFSFLIILKYPFLVTFVLCDHS